MMTSQASQRSPLVGLCVYVYMYVGIRAFMYAWDVRTSRIMPKRICYVCMLVSVHACMYGTCRGALKARWWYICVYVTMVVYMRICHHGGIYAYMSPWWYICVCVTMVVYMRMCFGMHIKIYYTSNKCVLKKQSAPSKMVRPVGTLYPAFITHISCLHACVHMPTNARRQDMFLYHQDRHAYRQTEMERQTDSQTGWADRQTEMDRHTDIVHGELRTVAASFISK